MLVPGKQNVKARSPTEAATRQFPGLGQRASVPIPARAPGGLAAKNKCLADSNKTRAENKATNKRLHPGQYPPVVVQTRDRVSSLPRWRGPTSSRFVHI